MPSSPLIKAVFYLSWLLTILCSLSSSALAQTCVQPPAGLVNWWPGDGTAEDMTYDNHSTLQNGATFATGAAGQAFAFDGVDDFVLVPDAPSLNPANAITLEAWVFVTGNEDQYRDIISKDGEGFDRQYLLTVSDVNRFRPHVGVPAGFLFFDGTTTVELTTWHHIAMTYDGASLKLYVNGMLDGSMPVTGLIITTSQPVRIGGGAPEGFNPLHFPGLIDEVTMYNRALTAAEILAIFNAGSAGKCKDIKRPNFIVILTDDLDTAALGHLPRLQALLSAQGTTFANSFASLALCCPSRASFLRGQYAHNTQIFRNVPPGGGFQDFHALGHEDSTVATWLHDAGYRTVLLGKYLNGYQVEATRTHVPPGWDEWYGFAGGLNYFNYQLNENGTIVPYGASPADYLTDVLAGKAAAFIQRVAANAQPFFMFLAPSAPHQEGDGPATAAARHADAFPGVTAPRPSSFNEADVRDKPAWVKKRPRLTGAQITALDLLHRTRLQSLLAVEDLLEQLIQTLHATDQLQRTYILFTSDNGFHLGQHRLPAGKSTAYEEDLRVPLLVRGPGVPAGRVLEHLAVNIDLAPTFAELAGAVAPEFVDGRSLVPLFGPQPPPLTAWRQAFLLESGFLTGARVFQGLRTTTYTYIEYVNTGERELYNLVGDPEQLHSVHGTAEPALLAQLAAWLAQLRTCVGAACRAAEETLP